MESTLPISDIWGALSALTLVDVEKRLADLESERAQLSLLRRSLAARDRAKRRANQFVEAAQKVVSNA
jgi:hypothetical protein